MVKLVAFYLPQYHQISENDEWWGDGYTEWSAVKRAIPLFHGHIQPRVPFNDNYYNLLDVNAVKWQHELAKKYGIYGFCYYHYWFKGKRLLEKPLELIIKHKELDLPFCLSWANQSWTRTWYGKETDILILQDYGDQNDWKHHFDYLLPLFLDERYIKIGNKPVFIIYDSANIEQCQAMLDYWSMLAKQNGVEGIYFIKTLAGFPVDRRVLPFDAQLIFEPGYTLVNEPSLIEAAQNKTTSLLRYLLRKYFGFRDRKVDRLSGYDDIYRRIIKRQPNSEKTYLGAFTDWDNSPRRGYRSTIFRGGTPEKFERYLSILINRSINLYHSDFVFINAWNEWGEGAYLEPDKQFEDRYLQSVSNALNKSNGHCNS